MKHKNNSFAASVIIPTYNRKELLGYTFESLLKQSIDPQTLEILVVDDGSSDNTLEVIEKYKDLLNIKYFYQEDKGFRVASARNMGLTAASADICILIDAGIILPSWGIEEHLNSHYLSSESIAVIGYVYGLQNAEGSNEDLINFLDIKNPDLSLRKIKARPKEKDMREEVFKRYNYDLGNFPAPWIFYWGGNVSFDKTVFSKDEFYFNEVFNRNWGCEDVEFGYRLFKKGVKIVLNKKAESIHYPHEKESGFEKSSKINVEKFHKIYNTPETKLLHELSLQNIDSIYLNDYLLSPLPKVKN